MIYSKTAAGWVAQRAPKPSLITSPAEIAALEAAVARAKVTFSPAPAGLQLVGDIVNGVIDPCQLNFRFNVPAPVAPANAEPAEGNVVPGPGAPGE